MSIQSKYITPDIKLSFSQDKIFSTEVTLDHHILVLFIAGEAKIMQAGATHLFKAGDIFLIPRNQLTTVMLYPKDGVAYKSVSMHLTTAKLKNFYSNLAVKPDVLSTQKIHSFSNHPLLQSCLASVIPYFEMTDAFPENIASLKITEAISILREIDPGIDGLLANFEEPGKIDLVGFMEKNFMFNMPMEKFGYLTGRSLTTFKRDFKKAFNTTPQKWLTQKRLELAHYHFAEKKKKPVDVYFEVGFENLSHFSYAFKKHFGYAPTELLDPKFRH